MYTQPSGMKIERHRVKSLMQLLRAQHFLVSWQYAQKRVDVHIIKGEEKHFISLLVEDPMDTHYKYISSKVSTIAMNDTFNKHLGLHLQFDYSQLNSKASSPDSSQIVTKTMLDAICSELVSKDYLLVWDYPAYYVELLIGKEGEGHTLTFSRKADHFILVSAYVTNQVVREIIEKHSNAKILLDLEIKTNKQLKMEIDYHLMELYEYIQESNESKIKEIKNKLTVLQEQLQSQLEEISQ